MIGAARTVVSGAVGMANAVVLILFCGLTAVAAVLLVVRLARLR